LILTVDTAGTVTGWYETSGGVDISYDPVKGFWSAAGRKLTIYRAIGGTTANTSPEQIQVFTGYMFPASVSSPSGPQRLAGFFEAFAGTGGSAARSVFGWFATK